MRFYHGLWINLFCCALSLAAAKPERALLEVIINGHNVGAHFFQLTDNNDVLTNLTTLQTLRLKEQLWQHHSEKNISLKSLNPHLKFSLDRDSGVLNLALSNEHFETQTIKEQSVAPPILDNKVVLPKPFSAFLNYQLETSLQSNQSKRFNVPLELGINFRNFLFLNNFYANYDSKNGNQFNRLQSQFIWDDQPKMNRLILGDISTLYSALSGGGAMAGISWQRHFALNRSFNHTPDWRIQTVIETPSRASLYSNGHLLKEWDILPGNVVFSEVSRYVGQGALELVLTDAFGRERRIQQSFLFTPQLLKENLHEYSYNLGVMKQGTNYEQHPVSIGFHRYGFSNSITGGFAYEVDKKLLNISPNFGVSLGDLGLLEVAIAYSKKQKTGVAKLFRYSGQFKKWNLNIDAKTQSIDYKTLNQLNNNILPSRYSVSTSIDYRLNEIGSSVGLIYNTTKNWDHNVPDNQHLSLSFRMPLCKGLMVSMNAGRDLNDVKQYEWSLNITYYPPPKEKMFYDNANYRISHHPTQTIEQEANIQKNIPRAQGFGYNLTLKEQDITTRTQYKDEKAIYNAYYNSNTKTANMSVAGSIAMVDKEIYVGRPIHDSFAIVNTQGLTNVPVRAEGGLVGNTSQQGKLLVAELQSYHQNNVSISPKDLPLTYSMNDFEKIINIQQRGGNLIQFKVTNFSAVEGYLYHEEHPQNREYLALLPFAFQNGEETIENFTGKHGYFYLEKLPVGKHSLEVQHHDGRCFVQINVPETSKLIVKLGNLPCVSKK